MTPRVFSETICQLGEGPLWHPAREQLFWFDILGKRLLTVAAGTERAWRFDEYVSAAGWIDRDTLLVAGASALWRFDITTGARDRLIGLEADNPVTRSNDGRADPWGGFWIGTMGIDAETGAGAIYRYFDGRLTRLYDALSISNAICFAPDRSCAYFTDTSDGRILRQVLDPQGWPKGKPTVFVDLSAETFGPDGAVVDADGNLWNAQWGAGRVACYGADGRLTATAHVPTPQASCPAFGGPDLTTLFVTTAAIGRDDPAAGKTYQIETQTRGQPEHRVILEARQ